MSSQYLVYLPKGFSNTSSGQFDMRGRVWPMVVYLHGASASGQKTMEELRGDGINYAIANGIADVPAIVVSPLEGGWGHDEAFIDAVIKDAQSKYLIDPTRISLSGFSMGGYGAYAMAAAFPHRFSAVMPAGGAFSGLFSSPPLSEYGSGFRMLKDTPFRVFNGVADEVVRVSDGDLVVNLLREFEVPVDYRRIPGADHIGTTNYAFTTENLTWLASQRKLPAIPFPNRVKHPHTLAGRYEYTDWSGATRAKLFSVDLQGRLLMSEESQPESSTIFYSIGDDRFVSGANFFRLIRNDDGRIGCLYFIGATWGYPVYSDAAHAATCGYGPQN